MIMNRKIYVEENGCGAIIIDNDIMTLVGEVLAFDASDKVDNNAFI